MANFEVLIEEVKNVRDHPNADRLSLLDINGFTCVSGKLEDGSHRYQDGDPVAYIPEGSILPEWLLKEMDFWDDENQKGTLNGSAGNRVKAMRLRQILSQGIVYGCCGITNEETGTHFKKWMKMADGQVHKVGVGWNVADDLGITKYEPPVPANMAGEVFSHSAGLTMLFDVENAQKYEHVFAPDDIVNITEKLHGTNCSIMISKTARPDWYMFGHNGRILYATAYSKGLGAKGLCFKATEENLAKNIYLRTMVDVLKDACIDVYIFDKCEVLTLMGEVFGTGVQDLQYSTKPKFAAFDIAVDREVVVYPQFKELTLRMNIPVVPLLYHGPYSGADLISLRDGKSSIDNQTLKEGIVIRSDKNEDLDFLGRKMLKLVSPDYLTRKSKNATEYQ